MLKNLKIYSVVALATLVILGCGSDSDKNSDVPNFVQKSDTKVTMEKLRSLGGDSNISQFTDSGVSKSASKFSSKNQSMEFNEECINIEEDEKTSIFSANNCNDGDSTIDGQAKISTDKNSIIFEILQDFTASDELFSFFVAKGSKISMITDKRGTITFVANFQATVDNEEFSANNLKVVVSISETGGYFDIQTGKVRTGELYFEVEPDTTPIVIGKDGLVSGTIKLRDGSGQKMEMKVKSPETLEFKIDEDGDGEFSDSETTVENIEDFFDEISSEIDSF